LGEGGDTEVMGMLVADIFMPCVNSVNSCGGSAQTNLHELCREWERGLGTPR